MKRHRGITSNLISQSGKETFSVLHKCDLDILNPSNGSNADKILKCIDQTPKEFK